MVWFGDKARISLRCPNSQVLPGFAGCAPAVFPKAVLARAAPNTPRLRRPP
jgi:hypothetical protein